MMPEMALEMLSIARDGGQTLYIRVKRKRLQTLCKVKKHQKALVVASKRALSVNECLPWRELAVSDVVTCMGLRVTATHPNVQVECCLRHQVPHSARIYHMQ